MILAMFSKKANHIMLARKGSMNLTGGASTKELKARKSKQHQSDLEHPNYQFLL